MKTLYLLRHAKSDWDQGLPDIERPLNKRGKRDAPLMAKFFADVEDVPEITIFCSPAQRTQDTAEPFRKYKPADFIVEHDLYESGGAMYLDVIRKIDDDIDKAMLIGHNPSTEQAVSALLTGSAANYIVQVPTCCLIRIDLPFADWDKAGKYAAALRWMITPKLLLKHSG